MPYRQRAAAILADWRAAERARDATAKGSPERRALDREIERLRAAYNELMDLQRSVKGPPIPEDPLAER
jgi:hypothetical protein